MSRAIIFFLLFFGCIKINAQLTTFPWNGTYGGAGANRNYSITVSGVTMTATIVNSENVFQNGSPLYIATGSTTLGAGGASSGCAPLTATNQGLYLGTDWTTNATKTITTTISFSTPVRGPVEFYLYDINDDGFGSWLDRIIITGTNSVAGAVNIFNVGTACVQTGGTVTGSGTNTLTYNSGTSSACTCWGNNRVNVGMTNDCISTVTIRYKSANTTYNNPFQYIVISNLTATIANSTPPSAITGNINICSGQSTTLTATGANASSQWFTGSCGGTLVGTGTSISVSPTSNTTYFVNNPSTACSSASSCASATVTVNPAPVITNLFPDTICSGQAVSIPLSSTIGTSYSWIASNNPNTTGESITSQTSSIINNSIINSTSVNQTVVYSVTATGGGCPSIPQTVNVIVYPNPIAPTISASGPTTFCTGGSVTLTSSVLSGNVWSTGATTQSISVSSGGTYSVSYTNVNGCTSTTGNQTITVNSTPTTPTITANGPTTFCAGGSVTLTSNAITGNVWSTGAITQSIIVNSTGNYSVTVGSAGCAATSSVVNVTVNSLPTTPVITATKLALCFGETSTLSSSIASNYLWSNGATTQTINVNTAGIYSVSITNLSGCSSFSSITITQPPVLSTTASITNATCSSLGIINIIVIGGTSNFNYSWSNGATTEDITGLNAGSYFVTITDANGCSTTNGPNLIQAYGVPSINISGLGNVLCNGGSSGFVNITTTGGLGPFNYLWSNGRTTEDITGLSAGIYSVTLTDANGCTSNILSTITQPTLLNTTLVSTNISCNGANNGLIDLTVGGGISNYLYNWSNGSTSQDLTSLNPGLYTVTVSDANSCTTITSATITQPAALTSSIISVTNSTCSSGGSINVNINGGSGGYVFNWSNGATTEDVSGLAASDYFLTITDANGCSIVNGPITVNANGVPSISLNNVTNVTCIGFSNGAVNISVSGGQSPYTYSWNNGQTTEDLNALNSGTYSVTLTDNLGCITNFTNIQISEPVAISISTSLTNITCYGQANGSIQLTGVGGTNPYSYLWSNGSTNEDLVNIVAGNYSGTLTDANGCNSSFGPIAIVEPTALSLSNVSATDASCGANDGSILITITGGAPNYTYLWSNGATSEDISGLSLGSYNVTITDTNACSITQNTINISGGSIANISAVIQDELCREGNSGAIQLNLNGGSAPFTYQWNNGSSTQNLINIASGSYSVTVTDNSGCSSTSSYTVNPAIVPNVNAVILPSLALDTTVIWGSSLDLSGGSNQIGVISYIWTAVGPGNPNILTPNQINTIVNPDQDGQYLFILTAQSNTGCITIDSVFVTVEANNPQIPTAFSPNDQGDNNSFQVINLNKSLLVEFKIYNRWGQLVYNDPIEGNWDGTYMGVKQPRDVYMYVIVWKSTSGGDDIFKRGQVTLMR